MKNPEDTPVTRRDIVEMKKSKKFIEWAKDLERRANKTVIQEKTQSLIDKFNRGKSRHEQLTP